MDKVGIICDLNNDRHPLFKNYYYAVCNLYDTVRLVNCVKDLEGLSLLFIGDDHYVPHKTVWQSEGFISYCNDNSVKVVVITDEKILDSFFPWNETMLYRLNEFKYLYHYAADIDDCRRLGLKLCRISLSRTIVNNIRADWTNKKDRMVFFGNVNHVSYQERSGVLTELKKLMDFDVIFSADYTWEQYIETLAQYRFVFSPVGNHNGFCMRFYEILAVHSIPVQQVRQDTFEYYKEESLFDDCIYFQDVREIPQKIRDCAFLRSHSELWLEDCLKKLLIEDNLLK